MNGSTKIRVQPEGREGVYLADRTTLKAWISAQSFEEIHNFVSAAGGTALIGADHDPESVLEDIDAAEKVALLFGQARRGNMNHALALIAPGDGPTRPRRLEMYDLGELDESELEVVDAVAP